MHHTWETANPNFRFPNISRDDDVLLPDTLQMSTPRIYKNPRMFHHLPGETK